MTAGLESGQQLPPANRAAVRAENRDDRIDRPCRDSVHRFGDDAGGPIPIAARSFRRSRALSRRCGPRPLTGRGEMRDRAGGIHRVDRPLPVTRSAMLTGSHSAYRVSGLLRPFPGGRLGHHPTVPVSQVTAGRTVRLRGGLWRWSRVVPPRFTATLPVGPGAHRIRAERDTSSWVNGNRWGRGRPVREPSYRRVRFGVRGACARRP